MCVVASVAVGMGRSKDNVLESVLSIYSVGTRNQNQVIRLSGEHLYPRSYLNEAPCTFSCISPWLRGKVLTLSVPSAFVGPAPLVFLPGSSSPCTFDCDTQSSCISSVPSLSVASIRHHLKESTLFLRDTNQPGPEPRLKMTLKLLSL